MSNVQRVGDLEIAQDLEFQQKAWVAQRAGWTAMGLLALSALLGLFGRGQLSKSIAGNSQDPLHMEYHRFIRFETPTVLRVHLGPAASAETKIALSRRYIECVEIQRIQPEPESIEAGPDHFIYTFQRHRPDQPTALLLHLQPHKIGGISGEIGLAGGKTLGFHQFVYP